MIMVIFFGINLKSNKVYEKSLYLRLFSQRLWVWKSNGFPHQSLRERAEKQIVIEKQNLLERLFSHRLLLSEKSQVPDFSPDTKEFLSNR
ncbi:hypothetical protein [Rossellomorea vietnamensis]|uniref:hypothetical protein n=1 Tax=Rossellomorea vietnamensis TaxID=218284 RepID=UPI003CEE639F